ncbi:MAG: M42 family metallopeptidase [Limnochordia bacterium]|jgi:endoglucanase|nr:M42 family metallopeptidase [Limnochordia bacterium]
MKTVIKQLTEAFGPSGYETEVTELIKSLVEKHVDEIKTDVLGNLIATKKGSPGGKTIMLAAHTDEIGVVVTHIDDKGFLRFGNVGGVGIPTLVGNRVRFAGGAIGTIYHEKSSWKELSLDKLYIDIGAENKAEALKKVKLGEFGIFHREFEDLGNRLIAKSMDDRVGCAVLIEALKKIESPTNTLYFVFTTQEEVGLRGARTAAYGIEPDLGIALDVTLTGDMPEARRMEVSLGHGAAIKVKDSSIIVHPKVKDLLVGLAEEKTIPYQMEVLEAGGTDAGAIHLTKTGVPSGAISIPTRYVHSPSEMVDIRDVAACVDLVVALANADLASI